MEQSKKLHALLQANTHVPLLCNLITFPSLQLLSLQALSKEAECLKSDWLSALSNGHLNQVLLNKI